jgi:hypothetical protein
LWEKKLNFLLADQEMTILQYEISNTGDVYILTKDEVREKRNKCEWCLPYDFTLVNVSTDGNVQKVKIDVGEDYAKHARMHVDKKGNVFVLGYFTEKEKRDVLRLEHGIFFNKYNSNGEILIQQRHRWEEDFYTKLKEEHHFKNGSYARSDGFYVNDISVDYERKSMTLISEHCYKIIQKSYDGRSKETTRYEYSHANHLIIPSFDFDGNLKWTSCIEKESDTSFFRGNTISIGQDGDLYLIFNDKKTRKERSKINAKNKFGDTFTDFARINSTGEVDMRKIILNSQETGIYFSPHNSSYIGNGMILLFGRDNKSARHGLLKLP